MELKLYQFEVLVVIACFLCNGILRTLILIVGKLDSRTELDYFLSLSAAKDFLRELLRIDEVSRAMKPQKIKRKLASFKHIALLALCGLLKISVMLAIPFATLFVNDSEVVVPAVEAIEETAFWSSESERGDIDFAKCSQPGSTWVASLGFMGEWYCKTEQYSLTFSDFSILGNPRENEHEFNPKIRLDAINCTICSVGIDLTLAGMVKFREGKIRVFRQTEQIATLKSEFSHTTFGGEARDCVNGITALLLRNTTDTLSCRSAMSVEEINGTRHEFSLDVSQSQGPNGNKLQYEVEKSYLQRMVDLAKSGNTQGILKELAKNIRRKKLLSGSLEHQFNVVEESQAIVFRKVIKNNALFGFFGAVGSLYVILKIYEFRVLGGESDRTKFKRTLAVFRCSDARYGTSYQLRAFNIMSSESQI